MRTKTKQRQMPNFNSKTKASESLWLEAQRSAPFKMALLLKELKERDWQPRDPLEKEWFDELSNLCIPLELGAFTETFEHEGSSTLLNAPGQDELIPVITPNHSNGDYSLRVISDNEILTHCPASSGLLQGWQIPQCRETFQRRLYSRRSSCQISADGKLLASKTERDYIAIDRIADGKRQKEWKHPQENNSFRIEKFLDTGELLVSDKSSVIHFLSTSDDSMRSYPRLLFGKYLIACSNDGAFIVSPDYGKKLATVWKLPELEKHLSFQTNETPQQVLFSPNSKILVLTSPTEIQVRSYPFTSPDICVIERVRETSLPLLAISHDSKILAILRRFKPAELLFVCLETGKAKRKVVLPELFARHLISEIVFAPGNQDLLLAGKDSIYALNVSGRKANLSSKKLQEMSMIPIREFKDEDLEFLENSLQCSWLSLHLRPWVDMLLYLLRRRTTDFEVSEIENSYEEFSQYDIEIAD